MSETAGRRVYRSPLREARAGATRRRIIAASRRCFAETGYVATTMAAIAETAGVSVESVYAQGAKRELLLAAFESAFVGEEGAESIADRPEGRNILAADDADEFLDRTVRFVAEANGRASGLWRAFRNAADADPGVSEVMTELLERRRLDFVRNVEALGRLTPLRSHGTTGELADAVSFLMSPEGYEQLVVGAGWSVERYRDFIVEAVRAHVVR